MLNKFNAVLLLLACVLQASNSGAAEEKAAESKTATQKSAAQKMQDFKARNKGLFGAGVAEGKPAPDFTLEAVSGAQGTVQLSKLTADKPTMVIFGSYTCAPFRDWIVELEKLHQTYKDKANFVLVYEREMHPGDATAVPKGESAIPDAKSLEERKSQAAQAAKSLGVTMPVVVDTLENSTAKAFHTMPMRNYIIGKDGKVAFRGLSGADRGPFGFSTVDTEKKLRQLLELPADGAVFKKSAAQEKWAKSSGK